ncbi:MAG: carbohydrate kinase family protein, partial [Planctomycetota bacterium]
MIELVGIGVSVWDRVMTLGSFPVEGSVTQADSLQTGIGGGVTIATATAAMFGHACALIDSLGDDEVGNLILEQLHIAGVGTDFVTRHRGQSTSTASIWSSRDSAERTIVFAPGTACDHLRWNPAIATAIRSAKVLHANGRHAQVLSPAIEEARRHGVKISFDGGAYRFRRELLPLLDASDIVIVA